MPKVSLSKTLLLTAGAAVGALLFAPKSGKELRGDLKVEGEKLAHKTKDRALDLKEDFKESYAEAQREVALEKEALHDRQERLSNTIKEIEADLNQTELDHDSVAAVSEQNLDTTTDLGNVNNTPLEPNEDQVVPSNELENALEDNDLQDKPEFTDKQVDHQGQETSGDRVSGNVHNTSAEPTKDQTVPSDALSEALRDLELEINNDFEA